METEAEPELRPLVGLPEWEDAAPVPELVVLRDHLEREVRVPSQIIRPAVVTVVVGLVAVVAEATVLLAVAVLPILVVYSVVLLLVVSKQGMVR